MPNALGAHFTGENSMWNLNYDNHQSNYQVQQLFPYNYNTHSATWCQNTEQVSDHPYYDNGTVDISARVGLNSHLADCQTNKYGNNKTNEKVGKLSINVNQDNRGGSNHNNKKNKDINNDKGDIDDREKKDDRDNSQNDVSGNKVMLDVTDTSNTGVTDSKDIDIDESTKTDITMMATNNVMEASITTVDDKLAANNNHCSIDNIINDGKGNREVVLESILKTSETTNETTLRKRKRDNDDKSQKGDETVDQAQISVDEKGTEKTSI